MSKRFQTRDLKQFGLDTVKIYNSMDRITLRFTGLGATREALGPQVAPVLTPAWARVRTRLEPSQASSTVEIN